MNASSGRDEARRNLGTVIADNDNRADALVALAGLIRETSAPVGNYAEPWREVVVRLLADAREHHRLAQHARARLRDLDDAEAAAARWIPMRAGP